MRVATATSTAMKQKRQENHLVAIAGAAATSPAAASPATAAPALPPVVQRSHAPVDKTPKKKKRVVIHTAKPPKTVPVASAPIAPALDRYTKFLFFVRVNQNYECRKLNVQRK
jgi:hypothetical protein